MKVVVLTTSYPRFHGDAAGRFVADAVEDVRRRGVDVEVVSPRYASGFVGRSDPSGCRPIRESCESSRPARTFAHFGIAYGHGVAGNLQRSPWKAALLPAFLLSFARAARRAARDADVVHAHWLPSGVVGLATRKPLVVQLWGTDVELARRVPRLARALLRRARVVVCASEALADAARRLGARDVRVIPTGVPVPEQVGPEAEPPEVLFAGRLSAEKGILELAEAARGLDGARLVVAGDGPLRSRVPDALGFLTHEELGRRYARAAVVACPSRREGFGVVCAEAMAHGRPVVASAVGGLLDLVVDGETGLLVPPGDVAALRAALERLLADPELRRRLGGNARERIRAHFSPEASAEALVDAYRSACRC